MKKIVGNYEIMIQNSGPELRFLRYLYEDEYKGLSFNSYYKMLTN